MTARKIAFFAALLACLSPLAGCGETTPSSESTKESQSSQSDPNQKTVNLMFYIDQDAIEGTSSFTLPRGEKAEVVLTIKQGFRIRRVDYAGEFSYLGTMGTVLFSFENLRYDAGVRITADVCPSRIDYHLNGGRFLSFASAVDHYSGPGHFRYHQRPNTEIGVDAIERPGHTLIGWNTKADGTGEHIGLGSRVDEPEGEALALYAEWAKWSEASSFAIAPNEGTEAKDDYLISSYRGAGNEMVVVPATIDGHPITGLGDHFADGKTIESLALHQKIVTVGDNLQATIKEIYMTDADCTFAAGGFSHIQKIHINACRKPAMNGTNSNSVFPDVIDRLICNQKSALPNMIYFSGCSMCYGLDSEYLNNSFEGKYLVTDIGLNGDINMLFQLELISLFAKDGDILIHAPETANGYSLFDDLGCRKGCEWMLFGFFEPNYDLLSLVDGRLIDGVFSALESFNSYRAELDETTYEEYNAAYNAYGDCAEARTSDHFPEGKTTFNEAGAPFYDTSYLTSEAMARFDDYYGRLANKGVKILFSYPPVNHDALIPSGEEVTQSWKAFDAAMKSLLNPELVSFISKPEDYIFPHHYFYDNDYHMTLEGALERSKKLYVDVRSALNP